jgi:23S rRNA (guanosine2251-2'-O)-methyltransferase
MGKNDKTLISGIHTCIEALENETSLDKLLVKKGSTGDNMRRLVSMAKTMNVPVQFVPQEKLDRMTDLNHQGVVALMSLIPYHNLEEIVPQIIERGEEPLGLILDGVTDVRNFGAICRTAECFGAHFVVIPSQGAARINSEAIRISSGALHSIPICKVPHLLDAVHFLHASDIKVCCASEKSDSSISKTKITGPLAIVMGSEDKGVSPSLLKNSDFQVKIPMSGSVSSLNVGVAAGILLYWASQRG